MDLVKKVVNGPIDEDFLTKELERYRIKNVNSLPRYDWVLKDVVVYVKNNGCEKAVKIPEEYVLDSRAEREVLLPMMKKGLISGYRVVKE